MFRIENFDILFNTLYRINHLSVSFAKFLPIKMLMIILLIGVYQFSIFNYNHADMHWYQIIELVLHACYISLRKFQFIAQKRSR